jgi:hypothetical protein
MSNLTILNDSLLFTTSTAPLLRVSADNPQNSAGFRGIAEI